MWDTSELGFFTQLVLDHNGESGDYMLEQEEYGNEKMVVETKSQFPTKHSKSSTLLDDDSDGQSLNLGTQDSMDIEFDSQDEIAQMIQKKVDTFQAEETTSEGVVSYQRPVLKIQTFQKCHSVLSMSHRNVLLNMSTQVKNYYKSYCQNEEEKFRFWEVFGQRTVYKGLDWFNKLFAADLHGSCQEFFDRYAIAMIVKSSASLDAKIAMLNFLQILRQGFRKGYIQALSM